MLNVIHLLFALYLEELRGVLLDGKPPYVRNTKGYSGSIKCNTVD